MSEPSRRIRRGSVARSRPTVTRRPVVRAAPKRPSTASRALATLPLPTALLKRVLRWSAGVTILCGAIVLLVLVGVPQYVGNRLGAAAGDMGFVMRRVEPRGLHHLDPMAVYDAAYDQQSIAMPLVDLDAIRRRLLRYGWVEDARVSRRFPDTLVVDIVERTPAAIWQNHGHLALIDASGVVLAPVALDDMPDLPLVVGPDANRQIASLQALIAAAPQLKPMIAGATWIGGRRWDIRFQSGETLALPEGDAAQRHALTKFAGIDANATLLGKGYKRFDMRIPGKMTIRLSDEPGHEISDPAPAPAGAGAGATQQGGIDHGTA